MKIAVTYENGQIFQHFGHTEAFKIYDVENGEIRRFTEATSPKQEDSRQALSEEILADEEAMLKEFFGIE